MTGSGRIAFGTIAGAGLAALAAPLIRPLFRVPAGGVGAVTVYGYPKSWDYAVVALLIGLSFLGGAIAAWRARPDHRPEPPSRRTWPAALVVFILMFFVHDHPYALMDPFHEGEHLTAGWLMKTGERPYRDFFIFHGLATDAALDAAVLGDPPSPRRVRRLLNVLDALTLALLVPIAAEVAATTVGMYAGVLASLCAAAALWLPVFPYYRLLPVMLATLGLLRYVRNGRAAPLLVAFASGTLGVLWSLDTGMYALAGAILSLGALIAMGQPLTRRFASALSRSRERGAPQEPGEGLSIARVIIVAAIAFALALAALLAARADVKQFFLDSFVIMPGAIDAIWSLPAPPPFTANGVRYYVPPIFYGFLLALAVIAWRRGDTKLAARIVVVALMSALLFRTAAGRVSWSHTRFAVPLLGIAMVAFVIEPLLLAKRRVAATLLVIATIVYVELLPNIVAGSKLLAGWRARQRHEGLVAYPFRTGKGIYTTPQNATELAALNGMIAALGPGPILDFSNERALYYLLERKPSTRVMEISMLSVPRLLSEAMAQLEANRPVAVIVEGDPTLFTFDGVSNRQRVPELAAWIDANYPKRTQVGRFVVATVR